MGQSSIPGLAPYQFSTRPGKSVHVAVMTVAVAVQQLLHSSAFVHWVSPRLGGATQEWRRDGCYREAFLYQLSLSAILVF